MADAIPSMEELVEVGARAAWADPGSYGDERTDWDELVGLIGEEGKAAQDTFRSQARAILSAVLPLVLGPAGEALDECMKDMPPPRGLVCQRYRRTRTTLATLAALSSLKEQTDG